jgi:hypothetical protein
MVTINNLAAILRDIVEGDGVALTAYISLFGPNIHLRVGF